MGKHFVWLGLAFLSWHATAAELNFDFKEMAVNQPPPGFRSAVAGEGKPGDWKVIMDEVPPALAPLTTNAPVITKQAVLAQLAQDPTDEHFPMLIYEKETFTDFKFITRFKTVGGTNEEMAGIAFRVQDERNFYVIRASSLGNTFRFYKVVAGQRGVPIGAEAQVTKGVWHELTVECKGNQIRCLLDGREALPLITDTSFGGGKLAFWTKSDSVSYFTDARMTYVPQEIPAQVLVRDMMKKYPRLLGLKIFAMSGEPAKLQVVGCSDQSDFGQPGGVDELAVLDKGTMFYGKGKNSVAMIMPLRDRNGDVVAAVRVTMQTFAGQTEQNAIVRAKPIVKDMQVRVRTVSDVVK